MQSFQGNATLLYPWKTEKTLCFKDHLSSFRLPFFVYLGSLELIQAYFHLIWDHFEQIYHHLSSFQDNFGFLRLIQTYLSSFRDIQAHLIAFRLFQAYLGLCEFIQTLLTSFSVIQCYLGFFELNQFHLRSFELIQTKIDLFRFVLAYFCLFRSI